MDNQSSHRGGAGQDVGFCLRDFPSRARCERRGADVLPLRLTDLTAEQAAKLREVLAEQARAFREAFGK